MLVKDMIKAIKSNDLKIKDLAEKYGFSDRTIQARIKNLGFEWVATEAKYDFFGEDNSVFNMPIDEVFKSKVPFRNDSKDNSKKASNKTNRIAIKNEVKKASDEIAVTTPETDSKTTSNKTSKKATSKTNPKAVTNASDNIDRLLAGKKAKKAYRGFYFDSDVLAIIDNVENGVKSELINECLRKVFKEKGLL